MNLIPSGILRFFKAKPTHRRTTSSAVEEEVLMADQGSKVNTSGGGGRRGVTRVNVSGEDISLVVEVQGSSSSSAAVAGAVVQDTGYELVSKDNSVCNSEVRERNIEQQEIALPENGEDPTTAKIEDLPEMTKNETVEDEKKKVGGLEGEEMGKEEIDGQNHEFSVGDFVWGKVKNQHWYPGQIYNSSDASGYASKNQQKDRLLVAYFGDQSYGWCHPSELKLFQENFEQMLMQSKSKRFHNAVDEVLNEAGRIMESQMTCSCIPMEAQIGLVKPLAVNPGIKGGVVVPECRINEFLVTRFKPAKFLAILSYIAEVVSPTSMLELALFRRQLSAFNRSRGCGQLSLNQLIAEDSPRKGVTSGNHSNGETGDLNLDPPEEDWLASPTIRGFRKKSKEKWPGISEDKLYQRKKQRTMVDILADDMDVEPDNCETDATKEEDTGKSLSLSRKRKKYEATDSYLAEDDSGSGNSVSPSKKNNKKTNLLGAPSEMTEKKECNDRNADVAGNEVNKTRSLSRERKKSKYLSPPYTNLSKGKNWVYSEDPVTETSKFSKSSRIGERMKKAVDQLSGSPTIVKCSSETFHEKPLEESLSSVMPEQKKIVFKLKSDEMFYEFLNAALDPMYLKEISSSCSIKDFFTIYRSSLYLDGSNYKMFHAYMADQCDEKGKSSDSKTCIMEKDTQEADHPTSNDKSEPKIFQAKDETMSQSPNNELKGIKMKGKTSHSSNSEPKKIKRKYKKKLKDPNSEPNRIKRKYVKRLQSTNSDPNRIETKDDKMSQNRNVEPTRTKTEDEKMSQSPNGEPKRIKRKYEKKLKSPNSEPRQNHSTEANGQTSGAALLLNFASGVSLPTKDDLIKVFEKFGTLNESKTEVLQDSGFARVFYTRSSDAEAAFNSSEKISPFGPPNMVSYRLQYLSTTTKCSGHNETSSHQGLSLSSEHNNNSNQTLPTPTTLEEDRFPTNQTPPIPPVGDVSTLQYMKQTLQMMTSTLETSGDKLSPEMKAKLECDIRSLLKKVTKGDSPSSS